MRAPWVCGELLCHEVRFELRNLLAVVVLTNTAMAGMAGAFPDAMRSAIYGRSAPR